MNPPIVIDVEAETRQVPVDKQASEKQSIYRSIFKSLLMAISKKSLKKSKIKSGSYFNKLLAGRKNSYAEKKINNLNEIILPGEYREVVNESVTTKPPAFKLIDDVQETKFCPIQWVLPDPLQKIERRWQESLLNKQSPVILMDSCLLNSNRLCCDPCHKLMSNGHHTFYLGKYGRHLSVVKRITVDKKAFDKNVAWVALAKWIACGHHHRKQNLSPPGYSSFVEIFEIFLVSHYLFVFMAPAINHTLHYHVKQGRTFFASEVRKWSAQLLNGIVYLKNNAVAHRSLRLEHLVLDGEYNLKIIMNFRRAISLWTTDIEHPNLVRKRERRTRFNNHLPPEAFHNRYDPRTVDLWSFGVVLCALATRRYPFPVMLRDLDVDQEWKTFKVQYHQGLHHQVVQVLDLVFRQNPAKRSSIVVIQNSEFYRTAKLSPFQP